MLSYVPYKAAYEYPTMFFSSPTGRASCPVRQWFRPRQDRRFVACAFHSHGTAEGPQGRVCAVVMPNTVHNRVFAFSRADLSACVVIEHRTA